MAAPPASVPDDDFRDGVVAMTDALGFRGIWGRSNPRQVATALQSLRTEALARTSKTCLFSYVFSDTVALGASPPPGESASGVLRETLVAIDALWHLALNGSPPLLFRGCISTGRVMATEHVIIGEAVDEAASLMSAADCAAIWFAPGAGESWEDWGFVRDVMTFPHYVPLRDGRTILARALNPVAHLLTGKGVPGAATEYREFRARVEQAFHVHSPGKLPVDVAIKKQNTMSMIDAAWAYLEETHRREMVKLEAAQR
jgi:hypothetical protein